MRRQPPPADVYKSGKGKKEGLGLKERAGTAPTLPLDAEAIPQFSRSLGPLRFCFLGPSQPARVALVKEVQGFGAPLRVLDPQEEGFWQALLDFDPDVAVLLPASEVFAEVGSAPEDLLEDLEILRMLGEGPLRRQVVVIMLVKEGGLTSSHLSLIDDFLSPPWRAEELLLRAQLVRQRRGLDGRGGIYRAGELVIDQHERHVWLAGRMVNLTFKEFELLCFLIQQQGRVVSRERILETIWGTDYYGGLRTVDVHVRRLRSKIEDGYHRFIETVWNVGYKFVLGP